MDNSLQLAGAPGSEQQVRRKPGPASIAAGQTAHCASGRCGSCEGCRRRHASWRAHREHRVAAGVWRPWADPEPAREHVRALLLDKEMTVRQIAAGAGVSRTLIASLRDGTRENIRPGKADAILAVRPGPATPHARICATGTTRRIRALMALGWRASDQAARSGLAPTTISELAAGQEKTTASAAGAIRGTYDELWNRQGPSDRTRAYARKQGWVPPAAWPDETIDNPSASPEGIRREQASEYGRAEEVVEDSEELIKWGLTLGEAAARLRVSRHALQKARNRHGLHLQPGEDAAVA